MWNARLDESQAGIKIVKRNVNNLRYADDTTLMAESEELKNLLMRLKEEFNIQKTKIIASCPITSAQIFSGSKITEDGDCSHDDKPKQHVKKQRHHFADKGPSRKSYGFSGSHQSVQSLSHVWLFATPWIAARQASLSITNYQSSLKFMSIMLVMQSSHLILCCPLLLLPPIPPSIRVFSNESTLHMRWPKYWSFSFSIIPSKEIPGLMSFRMDWLGLLAVQAYTDVKVGP